MRDKRILYIEDEPEQLELVQMFLEKNLPNAMVDARCTVDGAETALNEHCYDLVLIDVCLPGIKGTTIAERILAHNPSQPVYLMSEYCGPNVHQEAERLGLALHSKLSVKSPAEFLQEVKAKLAANFCAERRGDDRAPTTRLRPTGRIRLTSEIVREARRAVAA